MRMQFPFLGENDLLAVFGKVINEDIHKKEQAAANPIVTHYEERMREYVLLISLDNFRTWEEKER